jgi:hypothetical protein
VPIRLELGGLPYTSRIDTLVRVRGSEEILIVDTKTRASKAPDNAGYRNGLRMRPQFLAFSAWAQREFGLESPPAVVRNDIVKTKTPTFQRIKIDIRQTDVDMWIRQQEKLATSYSHGLIDNQFANLDACSPDMGYRCEFFSYCHDGELGREGYSTNE